MGWGVYLTLSPVLGTPFLLLGFLTQTYNEDLCLVLLYLVMLHSAEIPGKGFLKGNRGVDLVEETGDWEK